MLAHYVLETSRTGTEIERTLPEPYYTTKGNAFYICILYTLALGQYYNKVFNLLQVPVIITVVNTRFTNIHIVKNPMLYNHYVILALHMQRMSYHH